MPDFDLPWQQPETQTPATAFLEENPFEAPPSTLQNGAVPLTEVVIAEDLVAGCGAAPQRPLPLLLRGQATATSRNPSVGYAQTLLNRFLVSIGSGTAGCRDTSSSTQQYIQSLRSHLAATRQLPLAVDCTFGPATETATKMFQACRHLVRDGRIGPRTWPELEALATAPTPTPLPTPPSPSPPAAPSVRVRQDVWTLSAANPWHPVLLWYARGVRALKARDAPPAFPDPRCWRHLADTHGTVIPEGQRPPGSRWNTCQHGNWFFLPWHRAYLHHFERIIGEEIVGMGGPRDWALPYWDYSDRSRPEVRSLPPAFKSTNWPDGPDNPLRVEQRGPGINDRGRLAESQVSTTEMFMETAFTVSFGAGFGGRPPTGDPHTGSSGGVLERIPHGQVHIGVGGESGLMSAFATAAQDPIFWLHHANIDRLWEAWRRARATNTNPTATAWLNESFTFGSGATITTVAVRQMVDTRVAPLGYRYSDMPVTPTPEVMSERPDEAPAFIGEDETRPPEMVGATSGSVAIGPQPTTATVVVAPPAGPVARLMEGGAPPADTRVYLRLENITATAVGSSGAQVFVNIPPGGRPTDFPDRMAGTVSFFGVREASRQSSTHSGSGIDTTFDITRIVRSLTAAGAWDPARLQVTFVPIPDATGAVGQGDVKVGRISVFYA